MSETYNCSHTGCKESGMTAAELAAHAVTHGDEPSDITLTNDPNQPRKMFGRQPKK